MRYSGAPPGTSCKPTLETSLPDENLKNSQICKNCIQSCGKLINTSSNRHSNMCPKMKRLVCPVGEPDEETQHDIEFLSLRPSDALKSIADEDPHPTSGCSPKPLINHKPYRAEQVEFREGQNGH